MDKICYIFIVIVFHGADMEQGKRDARRSRETSAPRLHAKVAGFALILVLAAAFAERGAWAQSGVIMGSAFDPHSPSDSLLPSGSFRLDGPSDAPAEDPNALWQAGTTSLGLQIYGSYNLQSNETEAPALAVPREQDPARP